MAEAKKIKDWLDDKAINQKEYEAFLALKNTLVVDPNIPYELERLWKALIAEWSSSISYVFDNKKIIKQWLERDFTYDTCEIWFNRISKSAKEADFARWLRDEKKWTAPDELNGWLTDDNISNIISNKELIVNSKTIDKAFVHRVAGDFRVRIDIAQIYDAFIIAQKSIIEGVDKDQLESFVKVTNNLDSISKKKYTIFPIRVSGNHWGMFIIGDDESGLGKKAWYTSSGSGVDGELVTVKPLINWLTSDTSTANTTTILKGQKQTDVHNCGVFLIFYIWEILENQKIELTKTYTDDEITKFRQDWQNKIGKEKWCILDSYWQNLRNEYRTHIISHPWSNPYETLEDKLIDEIIIALDKWMNKVIDEKFATSDQAIRDNKDIQIDAIKTVKRPLLDDEIARKEQYKGVRSLLDFYPVSSPERKLVENFAKQWAKILGIDEPDWKDKKKNLEGDIKDRLNKYSVETEFNKIGKTSFRGKDTWLDYLNTIDKEGSIGDTTEGSFYFVKSNLLYPLAKSIVKYLLDKAFSTDGEKLKAIEEYIRDPHHQQPSEVVAYGEYKTQIDALRTSLPWPNEDADKNNAIKRIEAFMKDDGGGRYEVSDTQLDTELALP